jgi:hypothetical protein
MSFFSRLGWLENNGLWDTAIKEIVGSNFAKILLARSWDERLDVGSCEIGCTIGVFGSGLLLDKALGKLFQKAQAQGGTAEKWAVLGRSAALFSLVSSVMWGMPFVRNYLTAKRTGSTHFTEVIGAREQATAQQKTLEASTAEYRNKSLEILGMGVGGAALATGTAWMAIRRGIGLGPVANLMEKRVFKNAFLLKDGAFKHLTGLPAMLFWGLPSYGGLLQASRDKYEKKEHLLKLAMFIGFFFVPPFIFKGVFNRQVRKAAAQNLPHLLQEGATGYKALMADIEKHTPGSKERQVLEKLMTSWKIKNLGGLSTSLLLFGTVPQLMNIQLTKRRLADSGESFEEAALTSASAMPNMNPIGPQINQPAIKPQLRGASQHAYPQQNTAFGSVPSYSPAFAGSAFANRPAFPNTAYTSPRNPVFR